jgi:hypothetical protein
MVEKTSRDPDDDFVVDPGAKAFLWEVADAYEEFFSGTLFMGERRALREVATHPETRWGNISTSDDPGLCFQRVWGDESKLFE